MDTPAAGCNVGPRRYRDDLNGRFDSISISVSTSTNFNFGGAVAWFDPEKMAVYRLARQHSRAVRSLIQRAEARGYADLVSQLRRSAASIPANLLEASGEWRQRKRLHYLMIAKGSTWDSWAHTDSMVDFGLLGADDVAEVRDLQRQITALLITTIRNLEASANAGATVAGSADAPRHDGSGSGGAGHGG